MWDQSHGAKDQECEGQIDVKSRLLLVTTKKVFVYAKDKIDFFEAGLNEPSLIDMTDH
jgi:hypothetical protein